MTYKNASSDNTELTVDQVLNTYTDHVRNGINIIRNRQKTDISIDDLHDTLLVRHYHLYQDEPTAKQAPEYFPASTPKNAKKNPFNPSSSVGFTQTSPRWQFSEDAMSYISGMAHAELEFKATEDYCIKSVPGYFTEWGLHSFFMSRTPPQLDASANGEPSQRETNHRRLKNLLDFLSSLLPSSS